jgi:tRNA-splicing ligase RtcB (3'-phosphate/5'-hydroxy nucleic acid ligase)
MNWKDHVSDTGRGFYLLATEHTGDVPIRLFLTPALLESVEDSIYPQIVNAATFPGTRMVAITPDVHHGYGVPIGTVLLTDADTGAVAMGPVGYDIGCFTGDTRVPTLDGQTRTLRDLAESGGEHWIFSLRVDHRIVAAKATARRTRRAAALVRVTLDHGAAIECTPDHQFMLRDGSWREAQSLPPGASLMPFYSRTARGGYRIVKHPATGAWQPIHWVVARQGLLGKIPAFVGQRTILHHRNFTPNDCRPENLEFMGDRDHLRYHHQHGRHNIARYRDRLEPARLAAIARKASSPEGRIYFAVRGTANIQRYMRERPEHFRQSVAGNGDRGRGFLVRYNQSERGRAKSSEIAHRTYVCESCGDSLVGGFGIHNHRRWRQGYNHRVVSVEVLDRREDVYCLTVPDYGNFALEAGVFVHNCGMMSASSDVPIAAATPENRLRFNREVTRRVALGPGRVSHTPLKDLTRNEFEAIIRGGAALYVERYGAKIDRSRSERDAIPVDDRWQPPWGGPGRPERGVPQLATLGGGNHFIELQGNVGSDTLYVQMHSGSRGFGHGLATNYFHLARAENPTIKALDLGYFTPDSPHYASYLNAVAAGANFAIVNRFAMFEQIALAFKEVFHQPLALVYEISHNLVQRELSPEFGWVHVHRKGATRAFPGGHDFLKGTVWEHDGHPILIPGSNHDASFILRATPAASVSGYSVNHGAGRRMSRGAARRTLKQHDVDDDYRTAGIVVNLDGSVPIDESRDVYKSSREVVGAVTRAGLATVEHELVPLASIKGNE